MSEDEKGGFSDSINAVANLANAVPVYDDALKPIAMQTGKALETVGRAVNVALAPVRGLVWGAEEIENWLADRVSKKLASVPEDEIVTPDIAIAGPTLESLKFKGQKPEISELFANLLSSAMQKKKQDKTHPAFAEFINSLSPLDAKVFAFFHSKPAIPFTVIYGKDSNSPGQSVVLDIFCPEGLAAIYGPQPHAFDYLDSFQAAVENLSRLELVKVYSDHRLTSPAFAKVYADHQRHNIAVTLKAEFERNGRSLVFEQGYIKKTKLGQNFGQVCL